MKFFRAVAMSIASLFALLPAQVSAATPQAIETLHSSSDIVPGAVLSRSHRPPDFVLERQSIDKERGVVLWARCDVWVNGAHFSSGASSVIYKSRVRCEGTYAEVLVKIDGGLYRVGGGSLQDGPAAGPGVGVAASHATRWITTDYHEETFYTPKQGSSTTVNPGATFYGRTSGGILEPGTPVNWGAANGVSCYVARTAVNCG